MSTATPVFNRIAAQATQGIWAPLFFSDDLRPILVSRHPGKRDQLLAEASIRDVPVDQAHANAQLLSLSWQLKPLAEALADAADYINASVIHWIAKGDRVAMDEAREKLRRYRAALAALESAAREIGGGTA